MGWFKKKANKEPHSDETVEMLIRLEGVTKRLETLADVLENDGKSSTEGKSDV